jgi:hypothetical protein
MALHPFKGKLYAGSGEDSAKIYSTTTGSLGSWVQSFTDTNIISIKALTSVTNGGGYMYAAAYAPFSVIGSIYRTSDGNTWSRYRSSPVVIKNIVPFKGLGTVDSIYSIENGSWGDVIVRSAFDSNDPLDTLSAWDTVLDFASVNPYTEITSSIIHNGKFYIGTSYGGKLYTSANGTTWNLNTTLDSNFTNGNNYNLSALGSFGGYLYAATYNYVSGTEIWRTANDSTWTMVANYSNYDKVTSFFNSGAELWAGMTRISSGTGQIVKTSDGTSFTISVSNGFGSPENSGEYGNFAAFGNNLYYGSENYGFGGSALQTNSNTLRGIGISTGAQIWKKCLATTPVISIGPDQSVCENITANFNASPGFISYIWDDGSTSQSLSTFVQGEHFVIAVAANGCDATDTASLNVLQAPDMMITSPQVSNVVVCQGDSINVTGSAISNVRIPQPPISKVTNASISYAIGNTYDTIAVSGFNECACTSLYSVTIDSLYHAYDVDVAIGLYSPSGSFINLLSNLNGANFIGTEFVMNAQNQPGNFSFAPYTGQFLPIDPFSNLTGNPTGNWVLQMSDNYTLDDGVLKGWTLKFSVADSILTYSWNPSTGVSMSMALNTTITPFASANYVVTATNSLGCSAIDTLNVAVPTITATTTSDSLCYGSSATLVTDGSVNASWSPSTSLSSGTGTSVTATPLVSTLYAVTENISGCFVSDSVLITVDSAMLIDVGLTKSICYGDSTALIALVSSGTPPYTSLWTGGTTSVPSQYVEIGPTVSTLYTFYVTDAFGCSQSDTVTVQVTPSTDIYGHVAYSGGDVVNSNVLLYKYYPYQTHFDTVQMVTTDASGNYHFSSVNRMDYIVKVFPATNYTTLIPTYFGNTFLWDSASIVYHYCAVDDTLNIIAAEDNILATGPGYLHGRIVQDTGYVRVPGEPIPGIDVKLGRNPGGQLVTSVTTDNNGEYEFINVAYGNYTVFADIPGLGRDSSYTFIVDSANSVYNYLNYTVDSAEVHYVPEAGVGIKDLSAAKGNKFNVYPNPSKGNATIEYTLTTGTDVKLGVYNILGVQIRELVNTYQQAGTYNLRISENEYHFSSGVYFIALITNGKTSIHKIIITE